MTDTRADLVAWGHRLAALGLSPGSSGNISGRVGDNIVISSTGSFLGTLRVSELSVIDAAGQHIEGPAPSKEAPFHAAFYRRFPETRAVVHLHAPHSVVRASMTPWSPTSALPPVSPYLVMRVGQVPMVPYFAPGSAEIGAEILATSMRFTAVLLANHGLICGGRSVAEACERALEVEEASRVLNIAGNAPLRILSRVQVAELTAKYGTPWDLDDPRDWNYSA